MEKRGILCYIACVGSKSYVEIGIHSIWSTNTQFSVLRCVFYRAETVSPTGTITTLDVQGENNYCSWVSKNKRSKDRA